MRGRKSLQVLNPTPSQLKTRIYVVKMRGSAAKKEQKICGAFVSQSGTAARRVARATRLCLPVEPPLWRGARASLCAARAACRSALVNRHRSRSVSSARLVPR